MRYWVFVGKGWSVIIHQVAGIPIIISKANVNIVHLNENYIFINLKYVYAVISSIDW